ncbi:hypothetical protein LINPERHAP2_LOCUS29694 [Linum perenne]
MGPPRFRCATLIYKLYLSHCCFYNKAT